MGKEPLKENSDGFTKIEPEIYINAVHYFVMKRLHLFGSWLMVKTLPYVEMYSFDMDSFDEDDGEL